MRSKWTLCLIPESCTSSRSLAVSPSQDARLQFSPRCFPCRYAKVRAQATAKHEERILVDANVTLDELRSALTCAVHAFVLEILSAETLVKR